MLHILLLLLTVISILFNHDAACEAFQFAAGRYSSATTFVSTGMLVGRSTMTTLHMHTKEDGDFFDIESARRQLESLLNQGGGPSLPKTPGSHDGHQSGPAFSTVVSPRDKLTFLPETPVLDVALPSRGPLTTIERKRRLAELELLSMLDEGDQSLPDIWELWFSERGQNAATLLHKADDLMNEGPRGFREAEKILRDLVDTHGVYFAEPLNRLATIYYLQGRMEEALTLNKIVLSVKPWHVGALSHIVMVYAALGDNQSARQWAAFRLPPYSPEQANKRRIRWVQRAVAKATMLLNEREDFVTKSFGNPDDEWIGTQVRIRPTCDNDSDSWQ